MSVSSSLHDTVLILDFGSQVTQLIARRIREMGVYSEVVPFNTPLADIKKRNPKAFILSGGPASVTEQGSPRAPQEIFEMGLPILGICYGLQTMSVQLGGAVAPSSKREFGRSFLTLDTAPSPLFAGIWESGVDPQVWMSHGDSVTKMPAGFLIIAKN
jgi:GMP synthase (glutamine-hydrolysing)